MLNTLKAIAVVLAITIVFSSYVFAQNNADRSVFVRANALVFDDKKNLANDLTKEDFSITENGIAQPITYFAKKQGKLNLVIVADNTGSMRSQLETIISIGKDVVGNLMDGDEAKIIRFVGRDKVSIEKDWTSDKSKLNNVIDNFYIEGGQSALMDGLYLANAEIIKRYDGKKDGRYAIVLISDCEERDSYRKVKELYSLIGDRDIPIFTVAMTKEIPKRISKENIFLNKSLSEVEALSNSLAMRTGGTLFVLGAGAKGEDYPALMKSLVYELRSPYVIGFEAKGVTKKTNARTISIVAKDGPKGEKRSVTSKTSIMLPLD